MEGRNLVFLITLGSSLLENILKNNSEFGKTDLDNVSKKIDEKYLSGVDITYPISFQFNSIENGQFNLAEKVFENIDSNTNKGESEKSYLRFYKKFLSNQGTVGNNIFSVGTNNRGIEDLSAELKTLSLLLKELNVGEVCKLGNCEVVLFPTLTYSGVLTSQMLAKLINSTWGINIIKVVFSKNLTSADDLNFRDGIKNFIGNLYKEIRNASYEGNEAFIIASGGYKAVVPYANIVGVLTKTGVYYAYEDSEFLVKLPSFPLDIKNELIKANQINLNVLSENSNNSKIYDSLPEELKNLFIEDNGTYKKSEFYDTIMSIYKDSIVKTSLQKQVSSMNILKKLGENTTLFNYFTVLSELGSYFWIGDKIPELVDHAEHHHSNLFIIADTIMSQILSDNQNYFSPEEIFLILGTIYFHDWGHVLSSIRLKDGSERQLLPTEIRDFHHILSYERLKNKYKDLFNVGLKWGNDADELWQGYLKYIALLSLYHRKAMPLLEEDNQFYFYVTKDTYGPLVKANEDNRGVKLGGEQLNGQEIKTDRFVFLEALFRVIDSLDTQFVRAGSIDELIFKFIMFEVDAENEERRLENLKKLISPGSLECYTMIYEAIKQGYQSRANKGETGGYSDSTYYDNLNEFLKKDPLLFLYLESKLKIMFRTDQREHFVKHLFLSTPRIEVEKNSDNFEIKVLLEKNADFEENFTKLVKGINEKSRNDLESYKKKLTLQSLCEDIASDYNRVKNILNNHSLVFKFMIKDENG
jgi:putative CRISPR-associated protein (TIGR02619 family)